MTVPQTESLVRYARINEGNTKTYISTVAFDNKFGTSSPDMGTVSISKATKKNNGRTSTKKTKLRFSTSVFTSTNGATYKATEFFAQAGDKQPAYRFVRQVFGNTKNDRIHRSDAPAIRQTLKNGMWSSK
jgi:hypothetical protein